MYIICRNNKEKFGKLLCRTIFHIFNFGIITSYINNRQQRVIVNGTISDFQKVVTEVTQGTALGLCFSYCSSMTCYAYCRRIHYYRLLLIQLSYQLIRHGLKLYIKYNYLDIIYSWLELNEMLIKRYLQFCFRTGKSTIDALQKIRYSSNFGER